MIRAALALVIGASPAWAQGTSAQTQSSATAQPSVGPDGTPITTQSADPAAPAQLTAPSTAQTDQPRAAAEVGREIVVTGTRITSSGFSAPTPTQVLGAAEIAKNAEPNIFTTIAQLPSLQGLTGVTTGPTARRAACRG